MAEDSLQKCVMIVAGDTSGDIHGSKLVRAMRDKRENLFFCGIGGHALRDAGVRLFLDTSALSVVGVTEVLTKLPRFISGVLSARKILKILRPDLIILVDFPGFNLPFSAVVKRYNIRILYYISPQVWAWRQGRVNKIRRRIDHMAVILPFEETFYRKHRVTATYVGHPLLDNPVFQEAPAAESVCRDSLVIGLLPGSRDQEISRHMPVMLEAAEILTRRIGNVRFVLSLASSVDRQTLETFMQRHRRNAEITLVPGGADKVFKQSTLSVVASGTVTLEAALYGMPMVIIYKVSPVTYWIGKALIRGVSHIGLANLIAGEGVVPELLQHEASAEKISETVIDMLGDTPRLQSIKKQLLDVRNRIGRPGASERTADIALRML